MYLTSLVLCSQVAVHGLFRARLPAICGKPANLVDGVGVGVRVRVRVRMRVGVGLRLGVRVRVRVRVRVSVLFSFALGSPPH